MSKQTDKQSLELWVKFHEGLAKNIPVDESLSRREIEPSHGLNIFSRIMRKVSLHHFS